MPISQKYPTVLPTLLLDFANSKVLDPRITFTRASTATFCNDVGLIEVAPVGAARFDHNPATGESLGLLIEEQRVNLLLQSSNYAATWFQSNVTPTYNDSADPTGAIGATKFVIGASSGAIGQGVVSTAISHTASVYLRTNSGTTTTDLVLYRNSPFAVVGSKTVTLTTVWQRFDVTGTFLDTTAHNFQLNFGTSKTVYVWGAQFEAGACATSYIPTVASQVTRSEETASIQNITGFFNSVEGTLFFETGTSIPVTGQDTYPAIGFTPSNLSSSRTIQVFVANQGSGFIYLVRTVSGDVVGLSSGASERLTPAKIAFAYKANDFAYVVDKTSLLSDAAGDLPTAGEVTALSIGSFNVAGRFNGTIKKITYYDQRLPNVTLPVLTA